MKLMHNGVSGSVAPGISCKISTDTGEKKERFAVKVINQLGDEVMKVFRL
jgi:hypothetical protein